MISPISILTRGRISDSAKRTITLASKGWLVLFIAPLTDEELQRKRFKGGGYLINKSTSKPIEYEDTFRKRLLQEDEDILAIINTFIECH